MVNVSSVGQAGQPPELPKEPAPATQANETDAVNYFDNQYLNQLSVLANEPMRK